MDRKLYLATLTKQGEYLGQLVTELNTTLQALEQALDDGNNPALLDAPEPLDGLNELQKCLSIEAEVLCKRLRIFLERSQISTCSPVKT